MENVVDVNMPGAKELGKEELKKVEGGLEPLATYALVLGCVAAYTGLCEAVHRAGEKIGEALAK